MSKKVLVAIADGSEELEAISIVDVLRRAGIDVTVASVNQLQVTTAHDVKIVADKLIQECVNETYAMIILPGGMPGAENLRDNTQLTQMLKQQRAENRYIAAICASPAIVFAHHGLIQEEKATAYPGFSDQLTNQSAVEERVVVDGTCITSRGPGTAMEFAVRLVKILLGEAKAQAVAEPMLMK